MLRYSLILFFILTVSCESLKGSKEKKEDNFVRTFYKNGKIKNEVSVVNKKRHGIARSYYNDGTLYQEMYYLNNVKHGVAKSYYPTGGLYQETTYDSGQIIGYRKKYRRNGKLYSEIPFYKNKPIAGLKEYLVNGTEKKDYPKVIFKPVNQLLLKNKYTLELSVTHATKDVDFYWGSLDENKAIPDNALPLPKRRPGVSHIEYNLPPGAFIMEKVHVIAKAKTTMGNFYITEASYNLAIENNSY